MPASEYHAHPAISAGSLDIIHKRGVPALLHNFDNPKPPTTAMNLGTVTHTLTLEPDKFAQEYILLPKMDMRKKENKEIKATLEKKAFEKNLMIIDQETYDLAFQMAVSVRSHPLVKLIMQKGNPEVSYFWEKDGIKLKARPDWVNGKYWMDLKTSRDASRKGFVRACADSGYHRRASFYSECALYHGEYVDYIFVLVNKEPPYEVGVYQLPEEALSIGKTQWENALVDYQEYQPEDHVFGFSRIIETVTVPEWSLQ